MDFATLLAQGHGAALAFLPVAFLLGALHALEPGHAKTMMAGFIVATHGTVRHAALLGLSAAVAHSLVVWLLALAGLWLGDMLIAERALPWMQAGGGLAVLAIAAWMALGLRAGNRHDHDGHAHHPHDHPHPHDHDHAHGHHVPVVPHTPVTLRQIVAVGFSGGLVPCPAAVPVLILSLQAGAAAIGVATVAAFSLGLAAVLVGVGVAAALGFAHLGPRHRFARVMPALSLGVVALAGLYALAKGLLAIAA
jgi:nickel/cobalt exporter